MSRPSNQIRIAIAGTGTIGLGLARVAATVCDTLVWARSDESADRARSKLEPSVGVVTDLEELAGCSIVVESIAEHLDSKQDMLGRLDAVLGPDAVLATTTSSLSVETLGEASGRPDRFAALHVFNPVHKMDLVEVAFPDAAAQSTRDAVGDLCLALGKTVVEVPDIPGFIVNRLLFPFCFEAVRLMEETELEPEAIDTAMKLGAAHPIGPLALLDFVGLDVSAAIGRSLGVAIPPTISALVEQGSLGRKTGSGLYDYGS